MEVIGCAMVLEMVGCGIEFVDMLGGGGSGAGVIPSVLGLVRMAFAWCDWCGLSHAGGIL